MNYESLSGAAKEAGSPAQKESPCSRERAPPPSERIDAGIFIMTVTAHIKVTGISAVKLYAEAPDFISCRADQKQQQRVGDLR